MTKGMGDLFLPSWMLWNNLKMKWLCSWWYQKKSFTFCEEEEEEEEEWSSWAGSHRVPTHSSRKSCWAIIPRQHYLRQHHVRQSFPKIIMLGNHPLATSYLMVPPSSSLFLLIEALLYPAPLLAHSPPQLLIQVWATSEKKVRHQQFSCVHQKRWSI